MHPPLSLGCTLTPTTRLGLEWEVVGQWEAQQLVQGARVLCPFTSMRTVQPVNSISWDRLCVPIVQLVTIRVLRLLLARSVSQGRTLTLAAQPVRLVQWVSTDYQMTD